MPDKSSATLVHAAPGRLRVRVRTPGRQSTRDVLGAISRLASDPRISGVQTDARTGSALVSFDSDELSLGEAIDLVRESHKVLEDLVTPRVLQPVDRSISRVGESVLGTFTQANRRVYTATGGSIDLRMGVPIALSGVALGQLLRRGPRLKAIPWYVLAYYSFDTFMKLHPGSARAVHDD